MPEIVNGITVPVDGDPVDLPGDLRTFALDVGEAAADAGATAGAAAATDIAVAPVDAQMATVAANPASAFAAVQTASIDLRIPTTGADYFAPNVEAVNTVAASGTTETLPDPLDDSISDVTLTANCTLTFPTPVAGQSFTLVLRQDATGSRTVTWPGTIKWASGGAPTLSTAASAIDVISFFSPAGTSWYGAVAGLSFA